jgi:uncharacterized membrane protein (UPF0127 family)
MILKSNAYTSAIIINYMNSHIPHHLSSRSMIIFVSAAAAAALLTVILLKTINNSTNAFVPGINSLDPYSNNSKLRPSSYLKAGITINGFSLAADVPTTNDQFQKGLDIKDRIDDSQGMLFIFKVPDKVPFWMHGMKFPIDIIWFDNNSRVVHIEHNLQPCITDLVCPLYSPEKNALYVLETAAGFSGRHNVKVGTQMNFRLIK